MKIVSYAINEELAIVGLVYRHCVTCLNRIINCAGSGYLLHCFQVLKKIISNRTKNAVWLHKGKMVSEFTYG